ncbi:MAG: hypothetical protein AAGB35_00065 [Pseudomonadota bacterium]
MLLDMQIYIPSQDPLAHEDFALTPRKVKKWIKSASLADPQKASTELIELISNSNRVTFPSKQRYASLEILAPICKSILAQHSKSLSHQTFPLSGNAVKSHNFQQSILAEIAISYKIIIAEAVHGDNSLNQKKLLLSLFKAICCLKQEYVSSLLTYQKISENIWPDICQLYRVAEFYDFQNRVVQDRELSEKTTIANIFKYLCSLTMISFNKLRQGEASAIIKFLNKNCQLIEIQSNLETFTEDYIYLANLATGKPPSYYIPREVPISSENRFVLYSLFINKLSELKQKYVQSHSYYLHSDDEIDPDLANRLIEMIGKPTQRSKKRLKSNQKVKAIICLDKILETLNPEQDEPDPLAEDSYILHSMALLPIEEKSKIIFDESKTGDSQCLDISQNLSDIWEHDSELNSKNEQPEEIKNNDANETGTWKIDNYSSGGFCLTYDTDGSCKTRVGEIIAIRDTNNADQTIQWLTGTIRWMQCDPQHSNRIGVELFGAECAFITIHTNNNDSTKYHGLLLKKIEDNEKKFSLLVPTRVSFDSNDIVIRGKKSERSAILGQTLEKTSSFTHFEILEIATQNQVLNNL